jgi:hypothetical protein
MDKGETNMTQFLHTTLDDMRGGRQSWRVILMLTVPAFAISLLFAVAQHI